ncbi:MAG: tetratricopeptide repeat protein [Desulfovibrionaceae bacterium]
MIRLSGVVCGLVCLLLVLPGCVGRPPDAATEPGIWPVCTPEQAEALAADNRLSESLECFAGRARQAGKDVDAADLLRGRELGLEAVRLDPGNGRAWYALAYLTGRLAQAHPLDGLALAKELEAQALQAARLDALQDKAGPDRMLGRLYLRAPGFPVSVGDPEAAAEHFHKAASLAPDFPDNGIGLAEALFEVGRTDKACDELARVFQLPGLAREQAEQIEVLRRKRCNPE